MEAGFFQSCGMRPGDSCFPRSCSWFCVELSKDETYFVWCMAFAALQILHAEEKCSRIVAAARIDGLPANIAFAFRLFS